MTELLSYVNSLVASIRVCVVEPEEEVCYQIEDALTVYNCAVQFRYDPAVGCSCLQSGKKCRVDLVFIADTAPYAMDVIRHVSQEQPEASIVILTRNPSGPQVAEIMRHGVYTFLTKNGSFTVANVRRIFSQLNLRLHASASAGTEDAAKPETQPV
jgi:DNA-binding NtrC family response regulator